MHVLPLPFGLALALLPRREAERLRNRKPANLAYEKTTPYRDRIIGAHYFDAGRYPF